MSEALGLPGTVAGLSGAQLLELAVERLLAEVPAELPEQVALDRTRTILTCTERLAAARLAAVADVDRRELFALNCAGSTRGWLRTQPGGENGQLVASRRLTSRPEVAAALAGGRVSSRATEQLCAVLEQVPTAVEEELLAGVLLDGVGGLLQTFTGGLVPDDAVTADLLAARAADHALLQACLTAVGTPAQRLEPALVRLAERLTPSHLGPGLRQLLEALLPDGSDGVDRDPYFFELRELLDGDVDIRGHLTPEVGHGLAAEIARRVQAAAANAANAANAAKKSVAEQPAEQPAASPADPRAPWDAAPAPQPAPQPDQQPDPDVSLPRELDPHRPISAGRRRHDALAQLLHDLAAAEPGSGRPAPHRLTILSTLGALEGRLGALPAQLTTTGPPATLTRSRLRALACSSDLDAVLLDALGNPVGASHTRRNLTRRERRALKAQWGSTCAVLGCPNTVTVPHHVEPFWLTGHTRLRDMIPACEHCHHDLHDGHRTLRLRDGRLINEYGWVTTRTSAA